MIFWLSISLAVLGYLVGASGLMTDAGLDPDLVKRLIAIMSLVLGVGNTIVAAIAQKPAIVTKFTARLWPGS